MWTYCGQSGDRVDTNWTEQRRRRTFIRTKDERSVGTPDKLAKSNQIVGQHQDMHFRSGRLDQNFTRSNSSHTHVAKDLIKGAIIPPHIIGYLNWIYGAHIRYKTASNYPNLFPSEIKTPICSIRPQICPLRDRESRIPQNKNLRDLSPT